MDKLQTLELLRPDGSGLQSLPCVQSFKLDGNTLHFKLADHDQQLNLPDDLDKIPQQPWYQGVSAGLLFGHDASPQPTRGIDDDGTTVQIGNVAISATYILATNNANHANQMGAICAIRGSL
ncbi:MAG: hypothetical protein ACYCW6_24670 [Candidatus Xenobia bacterium]